MRLTPHVYPFSLENRLVTTARRTQSRPNRCLIEQVLTLHIGYRHRLYAVALLVCAGGCDSPNVEPPEIAKPLGYSTVDIRLPGCATPLPPVRDDRRCGAAEIGKGIDAKDVCQLLISLKDWVASAPKDAPSVRPDDWTRVRAVCVSRLFWARSPDVQEDPPHRTFLRLEADVPNRCQRMFVKMSEQS